jgi:hypothetical protein
VLLREIAQIVAKFGWKQLIQSPATDYGSALDHIYTNIPDENIKSAYTLESYYSEHKPIFIQITTQIPQQHLKIPLFKICIIPILRRGPLIF